MRQQHRLSIDVRYTVETIVEEIFTRINLTVSDMNLIVVDAFIAGFNGIEIVRHTGLILNLENTWSKLVCVCRTVVHQILL